MAKVRVYGTFMVEIDEDVLGFDTSHATGAELSVIAEDVSADVIEGMVGTSSVTRIERVNDAGEVTNSITS